MKFTILIVAFVLFAAVFSSCEARVQKKHKKSQHKTLLNPKSLLDSIIQGASEPEPGKAVIMYEIPGNPNPTRLRRVK